MNDLLYKYFLRYISVHVAPVSPAFNNSTLSEQIAHSTVDLYLVEITVVPILTGTENWHENCSLQKDNEWQFLTVYDNVPNHCPTVKEHEWQ